MPEPRSGATEEQLRAVLAAAGASGAWDWDIAGDVLHVDSHFAGLYGLDPGQAEAPLPTATFFRAIHPEDRPRIRIAVAGILGGAEVFSKEFRVITAGGSVLWMHARGQCHFDDQDEPVRFTGLLVDVTDRRRTEERLRIAQSAGGIGTFECQDGFGTVSVSSEFCRLLGLHPADRLPIRTINAVLCPGEQPLIPEGSTAPTSLDGEFCIHRNDDGRERWIARRGEIIPEIDNAGYRLLGVIYDVTESKLLERRLRELNDTLEQRVASEIEVRTEAESALRQAQKMEAIGQLTGGIAHDFNNLLTIILGSVDNALRRLDQAADARVSRALDNARTGAERAAALTQRLLAFSRRQPLDPRAVDVQRLLANMSELLSRTISETVSISIEAPADLWAIEADPNQLENAILNLAVNARDAMPAGGLVTVSAENRVVSQSETNEAHVAPGDYVAITVTDYGAGMDAATLAKVFDPFFTTKEVGKGTGLGLSMVYGFAKQSGGSVSIRSTPGEGTSVTLLLARSALQAEVTIEPEAAHEHSGQTGETVLVAEDDDDVRAYTVATLRELGYQVLEAADGPAALAVLEQHEGAPVRLLFTDVVMPRMSGRELASQARARWPELKVLYTSGYPRDAIMRDGRLDLGVELLMKPFTLRSLAARVREILDRG